MKTVLFKILVMFLACVHYFNLEAQKQAKLINLDYLSNYERKVKDSILSAIYAGEYSQNKMVKLAGDSFFPGVKVDSLKMLPMVKLELGFEADSVFLKKLIFNDSSDLYVIVYPFLECYVFSPLNHGCDRLPYKASNAIFSSLIDFGGNDFNNICFCYFLESQKNVGNILLDINTQQQFFYKNKKFISLTNLIKYKYGPLDNLKHLIILEQGICDYQKYRDSCVEWFNIPLHYKSYVKGSWEYRTKIFPFDTCSNIKYLLKEMKKNILNLSSVQINYLTVGIYSFLKDTLNFNADDRFRNDDSGMVFMGKNIFTVVKSILTESQLLQFNKYRIVKKVLSVPVDNYILSNICKLSHMEESGMMDAATSLSDLYNVFIKKILAEKEE